MKTLYLVRHAKAINRNKPGPDDQRPLTKQGRKDARSMVQFTLHHGPAPEVLLASPATRAIETAGIFAKVLRYPGDRILTHAALYDEAAAADIKTLLHLVQRLDDVHQTAMIFGHDPLFTAFAHFLCSDFTACLPTCAVVCTVFQVCHWTGIARHRGKVKFFHYPRGRQDTEPAAVQALSLDGSLRLPQADTETTFIGRFMERYTVVQGKSVRTHATYYDTFDWRLFKKTLTLVQANGALALQSLGNDTVLSRLALPSPPVFVSDFPQSEVKDHLAPILGVRALMNMFTVKSQRTILRILNKNKKTVLKLLIQKDTVSDGHTTLPLAPWLRLQPVRGYHTQARTMAHWLIQQGCAPAPGHLYDWSLAALHKAPGDSTTKLNFQLDPMMRADAATKIILRFLCQVIRRHEQGVCADIDTEFLHDFRVAVRRTRSALGQIKRVFAAPDTTRFKQDFAWLGRQTNGQRDLDVYLLHQEHYEALLPASAHADIAPFFDHLRQARAQAHRRLVRTLSTKKYADMLRRWEQFLALGPRDTDSAPHAHCPIRVVAQKRIRKIWQRVVKFGTIRLEGADDHGLHALRIECKKLRYLLEFFASLFPVETLSAPLKQLRRLQDGLGHYHDLCVQQETLRLFATRFAAAATPGTLQAIASLVSLLEQEKQTLHHDFAGMFRAFASYTPPQ